MASKPRFHSDDFREQISLYARDWLNRNMPGILIDIVIESDYNTDCMVLTLQPEFRESQNIIVANGHDYENHPSMILPNLASLLARFRLGHFGRQYQEPPFSLADINASQDFIDSLK
jgi:hypothetical protein